MHRERSLIEEPRRAPRERDPEQSRARGRDAVRRGEVVPRDDAVDGDAEADDEIAARRAIERERERARKMNQERESARGGGGRAASRGEAHAREEVRRNPRERRLGGRRAPPPRLRRRGRADGRDREAVVVVLDHLTRRGLLERPALERVGLPDGNERWRALLPQPVECGPAGRRGDDREMMTEGGDRSQSASCPEF